MPAQAWIQSPVPCRLWHWMPASAGMTNKFQSKESPMFLKGKSALVTGSTSGIGLAYAKALAAEGAAVMINGFGEAQAIEAERANLAAISGVEARYSAADMSKPDQIAAMVKECADVLGGPDIV